MWIGVAITLEPRHACGNQSARDIKEVCKC